MILINDVEIAFGRFPDNTLLLKVEKELLIENYEGVTITWKYRSDDELFALCCLVRHLRENGIEKIFLDMPYIPNARQDRVKRKEDIFTLKYFAEIINACGFNKIYVLDPHSQVSEVLFDNISIDNGENYIKTTISYVSSANDFKDIILYYPDNGAYKKYTDFLKYPACYGVKKRDWETGKILGMDIMLNDIEVNGKTILMVDDIISYGGSMYYSAKKLKELGCGDIYIYASHVEDSVLQGDLINSGLIKHIYTTNSLFSKSHDLITILSKGDLK